MKAAWLGDWEVPWPLGRGRRFGDPAWTLAAVARAWLGGGREGRWPGGRWEADARRGPCPPLEAEPLGTPDPGWIALLRHGSGAADPARPARGETPLERWAWEALLAGDAEPWLAAGTVFLDTATRLRWLPHLAAVDADGTLWLPAFLEGLVPREWRALPPGWWVKLLGGLDAQGRLLPVGSLPPGPPWEGLLGASEALLAPLVLDHCPAFLEAGLREGWMVALKGGHWMLDPALRAWGRGFGAVPEALAAPGTGLAQGGPPTDEVQRLLKGTDPGSARGPVWAEALQADLEGGQVRTLPPPCGEPSLDRLRVRWGGEPPDPAPGYPDWGCGPHPCADPFHWMAEGFEAHGRQDLEKALRAFTLAHAHFQRLGASRWARRAASNAATVALRWCDLPGVQAWHRLQGPLPDFHRAHEEAELRAARGEWAEAARLSRRTLARFPEQPAPWALLGEAGIFLRRRDWVQQAWEGLPACPFRELLEAWLGGLPGPAPPEFPAEEGLLWACARLGEGARDLGAFWAAWDGCQSQLMRLHTGLLALENRPEARLPGRLVALQSLADRAQAPLLQARVKALWPSAPLKFPEPSPQEALRALLEAAPRPAWVVWAGPGGRTQALGRGPRPPEALCGRLLGAGELPPVQVEGRLWWGLPLVWDGVRVGGGILEWDPEEALEAPSWLPALAPWIARLLPEPGGPPPAEPGQLLTDGSEPMAGLLRDLDRVAATELPVLILGPTGSGKELTAREIHQRSGRRGELVPVNCSAFAETLLESELFGHVKGAFTGADRDRKGAIELAEGGTLFLDEVADLSPRLQSLFLRVLQEGELRRVGSERARRVEVRFLAATHKSLEEFARSGAFRRDLLFRLQGAVLELPALAARRHEFPFLVPRLVSLAAERLRRPAPSLAPGLPEALARHPWPGNFRELGHALERALLRCGTGPLKPTHFPELDAPELLEGTWEQGTRDFQRRLLRSTLQRHGFRMTEAAQTLGLTRVALYTAARRLGLDLALERQHWEATPSG